MLRRTISLAFCCAATIAAFLVAQSLPNAQAQTLPGGVSKPVHVETLYVFTWPNGYSEIDTESSMASGVVSTIDFNIVGPELSIDTSDATYRFVISAFSLRNDVVATLQSYGLVDTAGINTAWPSPLPSLTGPASYAVASNPALPAPNQSLLRAYDVLHRYYQAHRVELAAAAQARATAPPPTPAPSSSPTATFVRVDYPSPTPRPHQ